jgi:hypothetical protein
MEELGPMMQATTVIRWGVMFASAGGSCPYNAPGTTSCSSTNAPAPGCNPITSCRSPQSVTECVLYCGSRGRADGGKACLYVPGAPCQTCNGNTITNPMCCTGAPCPGMTHALAHTSTDNTEGREGNLKQTHRRLTSLLSAGCVVFCLHVCRAWLRNEQQSCQWQQRDVRSRRFWKHLRHQLQQVRGNDAHTEEKGGKGVMTQR